MPNLHGGWRAAYMKVLFQIDHCDRAIKHGQEVAFWTDQREAWIAVRDMLLATINGGKT